MGIGKKLDIIMKEQGTNANELAQKIGVAPTTIYSMIKRDSKKADIEVLIKISKELGVEPEYFCDDSIPIKEPTYEDTKKLIARNGKKMTTEQKMELIKLLSEIN